MKVDSAFVLWSNMLEEDEFSRWDSGCIHEANCSFLLFSAVQGAGLKKNPGVGCCQNEPHSYHLSLLETLILVQFIFTALWQIGKTSVTQILYNFFFKLLKVLQFMSLSLNYELSQQSAFQARLTKPFSKGPGACWLSCLTEALPLVYLWSAFNHFMKLGNPHLLNCSGPQRNFMACHQSRPAERKAERCFQIKLQFFSLDWHNLSSAKEGPCVELL